jgi:transposase
LKNEENLEPEDLESLNTIRKTYYELGCASVMKEKLRNIYRFAEDFSEAEWRLANWCVEADESSIPELKTMAKTIRTHIEGILAYWTTGGITSAAVEGFNNKIRWLIRQAYGYHDQEYFRLKIFDLPNIETTKLL